MPRLPDVPTRWVLETVESDRLKASHSALWADPQTSCITCRFERTGSKTFRWWNEDRSEVVDWECNCTAQWIMNRYLLFNGIDMTYQKLGWTDATHVHPDVVSQARDYLAQSLFYVDSGFNLIFWSKNPGTGKSMSMMILGKELMQAGHDVFVAPITEVINMYTSGWRSQDEKNYFERRIMNCGVLIIDDLGKEMGQNRIDFLDRLIDQVIRHRVAASQPMLITTNFTKEMLASSYGPYVASLLTERCIYLEARGVDWRENVGLRLLDEISMRRPLVIS